MNVFQTYFRIFVTENTVIDMTNLTIILLIIATGLLIGGHFWLSRRLSIHLRSKNKMLLECTISNLTNNLSTPMTIISSTIEQLRGNHPELQDELNMIDLNIQRSLRLLQQMDEATLIYTGKMNLHVQQCDVMRSIRDTALCIAPLMNKKGLNLDISCKPDTMVGWADTDKIDKIIFNLLQNTTKYTGTDGTVTLDVSTNSDYDHLYIRISDNGVSIIPEEVEKIFNAPSISSFQESMITGTYPNLSLVNDMVRLHGGNIHYKTLQGQGTTVTIELPIGKEAFTDAQTNHQQKSSESFIRTYANNLLPLLTPIKKSEKSADGSKSINIILADDNPEMLNLMAHALSPYYNILTASNGADALRLVKEGNIQLVVAETNLPKIDGISLTTVFRQNYSKNQLPIITLTGNADTNDSELSLQEGADICLQKPFRMTDLLLHINNTLLSRQYQQKINIDATHQDEHIEEITSSDSPIDNEFVNRVTELVKANLSDSDYDRDRLASDIGASSSTLYNKLRAATGKNVSTFIRDMRIKTACKIAQSDPDLRVSDIAYQVGFKDPKYFATTFKRVMGMQPSEYFEKLRNQ